MARKYKHSKKPGLPKLGEVIEVADAHSIPVKDALDTVAGRGTLMRGVVSKATSLALMTDRRDSRGKYPTLDMLTELVLLTRDEKWAKIITAKALTELSEDREGFGRRVAALHRHVKNLQVAEKLGDTAFASVKASVGQTLAAMRYAHSMEERREYL